MTSPLPQRSMGEGPGASASRLGREGQELAWAGPCGFAPWDLASGGWLEAGPLQTGKETCMHTCVPDMRMYNLVHLHTCLLP